MLPLVPKGNIYTYITTYSLLWVAHVAMAVIHYVLPFCLYA